jgi:hypothetical protein
MMAGSIAETHHEDCAKRVEAQYGGTMRRPEAVACSCPGGPPARSWDDTETPFARDVLRFVNRETFGEVAWFTRHDGGTWETSVQAGGLAVTIAAASEEALAVAYWLFYYDRMTARAKRWSGWWNSIFHADKQRASAERVIWWDAWRAAHAEQFKAADAA